MKTLEERFSEFYKKWILKLEQILNDLLEVTRNRNEVVMNDSELQALVSKVTSHITEFYTVKWAEAHVNCLPFFGPMWLTPLENSYLWVTGFKPSAIVFRLIDSLRNPRWLVDGEAPPLLLVTMEQGRKIEELRIRTWIEEEKVDREMERIQKSIADPKMAAMQVKNGNNGGLTVAQVDSMAEVEFKRGIYELEDAMKGADCVRLKALKGVLDVLRPMQCVEFLATFLTVQLRLRQWGKTRLVDGNRDGADAPAATSIETGGSAANVTETAAAAPKPKKKLRIV